MEKPKKPKTGVVIELQHLTKDMLVMGVYGCENFVVASERSLIEHQETYLKAWLLVNKK